MIPKEIIYNVNMSNKRAIIFTYFATKRGLDDTVGFSCDNVVEWCGYKVNHHKDKINDKIALEIQQFVSMGYINILGNISLNYYACAYLHIEKFDVGSKFALIYFDEIEKICKFTDLFKDDTKGISKLTPAVLILVLSYIRVNMLRRNNDYVGKESDKPEFHFRMYIDIEKDIGLSSRYISNAVKILNQLDLIVSQEIPRYKDEFDNWHTGVTVFVNKYKRDKASGSLDEKYNYQQELEWGLEYIKEKKWSKKKFKQEVQHI